MNKKIINTEFIKKFMIVKLLTVNEFCKICKISRFEFNKIMKNKTNFSFDSLCKISKIIDCDVFDLIIKPERKIQTTFKL